MDFELFKCPEQIKEQDRSQVLSLLEETDPPLAKVKNTFASRMALKKLLERHKVNTQLKNLTITNHLFLTHFPNFLVSISHSKFYAAAALGETNHYRSVGIDLELCSRKIANGAERHFINIEDSFAPEVTPLQKWCMKEAAFKALSPLISDYPLNKSLVLKDIAFDQYYFGLPLFAKKIGEVSLETKKFDGQHFLLACAWISKL